MQLIHAYASPQQSNVPLPNWVFRLSWNPYSNLLASAHMDFAVRLWDLRQSDDDNPAYVLDHEKFAVSVAWQPKGDLIASSDADSNQIYLWDARSRERAAILHEHIGWPYSLQWSPEGQWLATAGADGRVLLWDVPGRQLRRTLWQFKNQDERGIGFHNMIWSPTGDRLIALSTEGILYTWQPDGWQLRVFQVPQMHREDASMVFSPDGKRVALLPNDGDILILDLSTTPRFLATIPCPLPEATNERFRAIDWSHDGRRIAATRGSNEIMIYDRGQPQTPFYGNLTEATALAWSPDDLMLAVGDNEGVIHIWQRRED